jgi:argininosuccinate lyase
MLASTGLLTMDELGQIQTGLHEILAEIKSGSFIIEEEVEDIHSQVELSLTQRIGEAGKKIHSGRSRNDQVLLDIKLYLRAEIEAIATQTQTLFELLLQLSEENKDKLMPGYTHMQVAMPSSFGLWFGAYAENLAEDMQMLLAAYRLCNKNPLGSGAGFGSSFPLDREMTTQLLGFGDMHYNVINAQMSRGKTEKWVATGMAAIAATLSKFAYDMVLYMGGDFSFISFPDALTTGSSIMPHKKNPDVFELIRAKCNRLQAVPNELALLTNNLPSGYHRDFQLSKECLFPAIAEMKACLELSIFMLSHIQVRDHLLDQKKYSTLFSVEKVNQYVFEGLPFREAYKKVAEEIASGTFEAPSTLNHTHAGSIGNLCNDEIRKQMDKVIDEFNF